MMPRLIAIALFALTPALLRSQAPAQYTPHASTAIEVRQSPLLRHVVLFAFKPTATRTDIAKIEAAFAALPRQIREVRGFEWGTNVSPENLANGFTHCFVVTFADAAGRDAYLPHPAHKAFVAMAGPSIDKALVVDFVVSP
jgi:Stress responsive A/B Barrel Domain